MGEKPIIERIDSDLEELMERFFINTRTDLEKMQAALVAEDFETLARLGHTAKGTGHGYGFTGMGEIGLALELAGKAEDVEQCREHVERMTYYVENVKVEFDG